MRYREFGDSAKPTVMLLHGAGLSWWGYQAVAEALAPDYHTVLPMIDGYGEAYAETFTDIRHTASHVLALIDEAFGGHVFALGGLSLGAQIAVETLARRPDIAECAVLESALVTPVKALAGWVAPLARMSYGLLKRRWFAKQQAKALCLPDSLFAQYFADSGRLSPDTLANTLESNIRYALPETFAHSQARALVIVGERELSLMRRSAELLHRAATGSELWVAQGMQHGELSLQYPAVYAAKLRAFFTA